MKFAIFALLAALLLAGCPGQSPQDYAPEITSFEECVASGYPVMESYPRQCAVPGGETFVEEIEVQPEVPGEPVCGDDGVGPDAGPGEPEPEPEPEPASGAEPEPEPEPEPGEDEEEPGTTQIANPASVYCEEQGGTLEIVDGELGQYGMCHLPGNITCEEWEFFRGECP